mgnify:FL=1
MFLKKINTYKKWALYAVPIIIFLIFNFIFDFNGLYGQDGHEYFRYSKEVKMFLTQGTAVNKMNWPVGFPLAGSLLSFTGLSVLWSLRIVSLVSLLGTLFYSNKIIKSLFNKDGSLLLILGAATQVYFVRGGYLIMSDMLCAFFMTLLFYQYIKYMRSQKLLTLFLIGLIACFAFFTRYASIPLLILPVVHSLFIFLRGLKVMFQVLLGMFFIVALIGLFYSNNQLVSLSEGIISQWDFSNFYSRIIYTENGINTNMVPNGVYAFGNFFHIGFLSFGVALIPFYRKPNTFCILILACIVLYILFLAGLETQNNRFLMLSHPLALIVLFPFFDSLMKWIKPKKIAPVFIIATLLFNGAFFFYSFNKTYRVHTLERKIISAIIELKTEVPIYCFYIDQSFPSYDLDNERRNFYYQEYDSFEQGALVIFNENKFTEQWKGHSVMNNWNRLIIQNELDTLVKLPQNWTIYRIK